MSEQELIVYCAGTKIFTTWETLSKLPKMVELDAEQKLLWHAGKGGKAIFIDRDPAYFAALVKKLRGYPLTASEQAMAKVELSFWGGQPEENDFGETVIVILKDIAMENPKKKKTFHFYQATLDLLPGLQNLIRASIKKENGITRVNVAAALWLPLRELQVSLVSKAPLYALHWHYLTSVGLSKHIPISIGTSKWEEKPIDHYAKTLKLSWKTVEGKQKKSKFFSFYLNDVRIVRFAVEPEFPAFNFSKFLDDLKLWRVINGGDSLRSASGSCQITWVCYPKEDDDDDDSSSSESSSSSI